MILRTLVAVLLVAVPASAEVVRIEVKSRTPVLAGQAFGATGPYRAIERHDLLRDRSAEFRQPDHRRHRQGAAKCRRQGRVLFGLLSHQARRSGARQRHGALRSVESRWQGHGRVLQLRAGRRRSADHGNSSATASCSSRASRCCGSAGSLMCRCATASSAFTRQSPKKPMAALSPASFAATSWSSSAPPRRRWRIAVTRRMWCRIATIPPPC